MNGGVKPFAHVPQKASDGVVTWSRQALSPQAAGSTDYRASISTAADNAAAIREHGIAFGAETPRGLVWLQNFGDNTKPEQP